MSAQPHLAPVIMVSKFYGNIEEYVLSSCSADTDLVFDGGGAGCGPVVIFLAEGASAGWVQTAGDGDEPDFWLIWKSDTCWN